MTRIRTTGMVVLVIGLAALGWATSAGAQEQVFRINNLVEPESLDPGVVTGVPEHRIISNLFEGLTTTDPKDLSPRPGMAARWTVSRDGLVYTFHLRDATWTDGRKVTAHETATSAWRASARTAVCSSCHASTPARMAAPNAWGT